MVLKTAMVLAKRFLVPTVVVLLMLGTSMTWIWGQYEKLIERGDQLAAKEIDLSGRKAELDKREFIVQQQEKNYQEQLASFQQKVAEYDGASAKLKQEQAEVSEAQRIKTGSEKIERLMSEFSALGVNLDHQACDREAQIRYNTAKSKISEISTLIKAYGLERRYDHFFNTGVRMVIKATCPQSWSIMRKGSPFDDIEAKR
jgi:hypothetical protein